MAPNYKILVIDDDEICHIFVKRLLAEHFELLSVYNAQEAINTLSENNVDLILSDIHMPGINGLEFLHSLMVDANHKNIPILIMTGLPTVEKEKEALKLGAADFIDKMMFKDNPDEIREKVEMKLTTTLDENSVSKEFSLNKKEFVQKLMEEVQKGDFFTITRKLCSLLNTRFGIDHIYFWVIRDNQPRLILTMGVNELQKYGPKDLIEEATFQNMLKTCEPYLTNHAFGEDSGLFNEASLDAKLPAEIGIPLFALTDREFLENDRKIPKDSEIFAYIVLKRNNLFTTKEYSLLTKLLIQSGTILWRYFKKI